MKHRLKMGALTWHENTVPPNLFTFLVFKTHFYIKTIITEAVTCIPTGGPLCESRAVSLLGVFLADGDVLQHVLAGAHSHRSSLVDALRLDVQDVLEARGGHAARLLHDEGHGVAFVQQAQL